jgi:hypothetical protein
VKKDEGNGVVATSKYCAKAIEDDENDEEVNENEENEEEENRVGTEAQSNGDDLYVFEALFKPLSSLPTLRFVASPGRPPCSLFPPSLSPAYHRVSKNFSLGLTPSHVAPKVARPSIYFSIMINTSTRAPSQLMHFFQILQLIGTHLESRDAKSALLV